MTVTRKLAFAVFGAYIAFGPGIYTGGRTEVSGLGYVRYENSPSKQSKSAYNFFQPSTEVDSGSAAAFILLTSSL